MPKKRQRTNEKKNLANETTKFKRGDKIKPIIEGQMVRLTPLDQFLSLRGTLHADKDFDNAIESLKKRWQSWKFPESV